MLNMGLSQGRCQKVCPLQSDLNRKERHRIEILSFSLITALVSDGNKKGSTYFEKIEARRECGLKITSRILQLRFETPDTWKISGSVEASMVRSRKVRLSPWGRKKS